MEQSIGHRSRRRAEQTARVLVVEDDAFMARAIERIVSRRLGTVVVDRAGTGLSTFRARATADWAGAIIDIGLPDGSGIELARALHVLAPELPMLIITGTDTREAANAALETGAQFAYKPMPMGAIDGFVVRALEGRAEARIEAALRALCRERDLSSREVQLVRLATRGIERGELAYHLEVSENTVKTQIRGLLLKCEIGTLDGVVHEVLRRALGPR